MVKPQCQRRENWIHLPHFAMHQYLTMQRGYSFNSEEELSHYKPRECKSRLLREVPLTFGNVSPLNFRSLLELLAEYSAFQRVLHNQSVTSRP